MSQRVVIIGAGVIGLCSAYYLAKRGYRVTVLDRHPEQRDGCSFGNAGMIVPSHFVPLAAPGMVALGLRWMWNPESPFYIKPRLSWDLLRWGWQFWRAANARQAARAEPLLRDLSFASRACFEEMDAAWSGSSRRQEAHSEKSEPRNLKAEIGQSLLTSAAAGESGGFGLVKRGLLMLCQTRHALDEEAKFAARANELGVPAEVLDAKQAAALDPAITMDIAGAVYFPRDAHLSPNRFMAALQAQCRKLGVGFLWEREVSSLMHYSSRVTSVAGIEADEFVLAGGAWSPRLVRSLGLRLPMQAGKGYSLTLPNPPQRPQLCSILTEARVAVTPMDGALRIGGTMEIAGWNEDVNPARVRGIIKSAVKYFPAFKEADFEGIQPWCGLRPCSPDGLPYLGRTARFKNLTIATGHAMMGLSLGPITGRLVAEILSGETPSHDLTLLSPDRFA